MNTKTGTQQFKPSTYSSNVSTPLLERIRELEDEISLLKEQIKVLEHERSVKTSLLSATGDRERKYNTKILIQDQTH